MAGRAIAIAVLLLLVGTSLPTAAFAEGPNPQSAFQMGYGPSALRPVRDGVPVYTIGDRMWISSNYSTLSIVSLFSPASTSTPVATLLIEPGAPVPLHIFNQTDREGIWPLEVQPTSGQRFVVSVQLVKLSNHQIQPRITSSVLQGSDLSVGFMASLSNAYDIESCISTNRSVSHVVLQLPQSIGTGSLTIRRAGSSVSLSVNGSIASPFTFWFELYHPYSYSVPGTGELVSRDVKSAESTPILAQSTGGTNTTLVADTSIRAGRATVRAFFDNAHGLTVTEAGVLLPTAGSWLWLDGCHTSQINSESFSTVFSLLGSAETWPANFYMMYRVSGVEAVASAPLNLNASRITFIASPWNAPLSDAAITLSVSRLVSSVSVNSRRSLEGIQTGTIGGTAYIISSSYPILINYSINFLGRTRAGELTVLAPYTNNQVAIQLGELNVRVTNGSRPAFNVRVRLTSSDTGVSATKTTNSEGIAAFLVPEGSYVTNASIAGQSQTQNVRITDGNKTTVGLNLASTTPNSISTDYLQIALIAAAVVGIIGNIVVLVLRGRLRGGKLPR